MQNVLIFLTAILAFVTATASSSNRLRTRTRFIDVAAHLNVPPHTNFVPDSEAVQDLNKILNQFWFVNVLSHSEEHDDTSVLLGLVQNSQPRTTSDKRTPKAKL